MALTDLQTAVLQCLSANRSTTSYIAGGVALNREWARFSDDIDVFHDTDEEIGTAAQADIETLRSNGFFVSIDVNIYGCVEATVSKNGSSTQIQWMSETRRRFFPLVPDPVWGNRLHQADLAVNKVLAASSRTKARDFADLVSISEFMCPLGPLIIAASGKPPHFSPIKICEEIRRRGLSVTTDDYMVVRGLPQVWDANYIRNGLIHALDAAESYILSAPAQIVGLLAVNKAGVPTEITGAKASDVVLHRAIDTGDVIPLLLNAAIEWNDDKQ
ncbi:hypothetical protein [Pararhizobium sp. O133]|uniref:hypothetical protein n=1 Tax=Pararhizobium sp. O133 TaxID=3449278 RepID=UPI003F6856EE